MARIAFIGIGNMGGPMARNLLKAQHAVTAYDPVDAALADIVEAGASRAASAAAAVKGAEAVVTMVPAGPEVREVYLGAGEVLAAVESGTLLIDCSTIDVASGARCGCRCGRSGSGNGRCAGLGRHGRSGRRHAYLHGRWAGGGVRESQAGPGAYGRADRPLRPGPATARRPRSATT